jgi:hypothetical protein
VRTFHGGQGDALDDQLGDLVPLLDCSDGSGRAERVVEWRSTKKKQFSSLRRGS